MPVAALRRKHPAKSAFQLIHRGIGRKQEGDLGLVGCLEADYTVIEGDPVNDPTPAGKQFLFHGAKRSAPFGGLAEILHEPARAGWCVRRGPRWGIRSRFGLVHETTHCFRCGRYHKPIRLEMQESRLLDGYSRPVATHFRERIHGYPVITGYSTQTLNFKNFIRTFKIHGNRPPYLPGFPPGCKMDLKTDSSRISPPYQQQHEPGSRQVSVEAPGIHACISHQWSPVLHDP